MLYVSRHSDSIAVAFVLACAFVSCVTVWALRRRLASADADLMRGWRQIETPALRMLAFAFVSPFPFVALWYPTLVVLYGAGLSGDDDDNVAVVAYVTNVFLLGAVPASLGAVALRLALRERSWWVASAALPFVAFGTTGAVLWCWIVAHR